jgi:hypothetical protein
VALAVADPGASCPFRPCTFVEWHLFRDQAGVATSLLSRTWPGPSAVTLELSLGRVTARAGDSRQAWVFEPRSAHSGLWPPSPVAPPHCAPERDDFDNGACESYAPDVAEVWAGFDWCNQLDSRFGRFHSGRLAYPEPSEARPRVDASRAVTLLKLDFGHFYKGEHLEAAVASRESRTIATERGVEARVGYALTLYSWEGDRPREILREEIPVDGLCEDLRGMVIHIAPGILELSGSAGDPRYVWNYEEPPPAH